MLIKGMAQQLADFMTQLSNKYYSDTWIPQLEFELWREIDEEQDLITDAEAKKLKSLYESSDGWIVMDYDTNELNFKSKPNWLSHYAKYRPF